MNPQSLCFNQGILWISFYVGKPKVIIVAIMRKMITTLNAMLRDNVAWQPTA